MNRKKKAIVAAIATALFCGAAQATPIVSAPFSSDYTLVSLLGPTGVTVNYGGIAFLDSNTLLMGGAANGAAGVIDEVGLTRDSNGHITGFSSVTLHSAAPFIDGGLAFGPGGVLFFTGYPTNSIGEIKPGSTSPDLTVAASASGVAGSVGTLAFVPAGFNGSGNLVIGSYNWGTFCTAPLTPDGEVSGTYDLGSCTGNSTTVGGGPEGMVYVPQGSADFAPQTVLISEYGAGKVIEYGIDANGLPTGAGTDFITGLSGAEGAVIDPVTDDFLFSTFGGNQIVEVQGFAPPPTAPEPSAFVLMAGGWAALIALRRRARRS